MSPSTGAYPPTPRLASTGTLSHGLTVGEVLGVSSLADAKLIAGDAGLHRVVQRLNVMEVPDILAWVKPHELLLTTGYPLRNTPQSLSRLVGDLDERGLAALAIKVGRYLDDLPGAMIEQADRLGFPLIRLPDDVGFDDILNQVLTDILDRQASILVRAEEIHRALVQIVLGGGGLQEVADEMATLLGAAVALTDTDGRVLVGAGSAQQLAALRASPLADSDGRLLPRERHGSRGPCAAVPIVAGGYDHGTMVAYNPAGQMRETDVHALERAATVAALVVTKQQAVAVVEGKYRSDFLRDVLVGRAGGDQRVTTHAASLGWDLARPVIVVVAEFDPEASGSRRAVGDDRVVQDRLLAAWTAAVRRRDPKAAVAGFSHEIVTVAGEAVAADIARVVRDATAAFGDHGQRRSFSTGVSRAAASPGNVPGAYEQAVRAVRVGRQLYGTAAVAHFDQLGVYRLLSLMPDTAELHAFARETLGDLARGDDPETVDLRRTLQVLLETNLNVAETARRLHFHYNTLRYRIGKLERLLGPFTEDANLRLNLILALHVLRMRGI